MDVKVITSLINENIKQVVHLHDSKGRKEQGLFIIEGERAIETALQAGLTLHALYCTEEMSATCLQLTDTKKTHRVTSAVMKKISTATAPSGLLTIFKIPAPPAKEKLSPGLVLAQISDPGNMGTLIRTAAACGVRSVVIIEGADPWSPKVVQSSAGTIAMVTLFEWDWETLIAHKKSYRLCALVVSGGQSLQSIDDQSLIIVGNEAHGIPTPWLAQCDKQITLAMPGGTESLNAAVAGSIALYEIFAKTK